MLSSVEIRRGNKNLIDRMIKPEWKRFGTALLDFLYPPHCPVCGKMTERGLICPKCRDALHPVGEHYCLKCGKPIGSREEYCGDCARTTHVFEQCRSLYSYHGAVKTSLYRLKYSNRREYARFFGYEMATMFERWIRRCNITMLVPIPLHPQKQRLRGYNQAAVLACAAADRLGIPMDESVLIRVRNTRPQKRLDDAERRKNMQNAFCAVRQMGPEERILLIDDIFTTGATADAAAAALKAAGAGAVFVCTVAIGG